MSIWILLVVIAQFFNAIVALVDKYIVTSRIVRKPSVYALYVSLLSVFAIIVFLFSWIPIPIEGVSIPSISNVFVPDVFILSISLLAGFAFLGALVTLFTALKRSDASDVIPVVGATSAVGSLLLSFYLLDAIITSHFILGFILLVIGTFFISLFRFKIQTLFIAISSGALFALHFVCLKILFGYTHFDDAFFWSRVGIIISALILFLFMLMRSTSDKQAIKREMPKKSAIWIILANKTLAGIAGLLILKGIELGDVTIVQALGGLQFVFLFGFAVLTGHSLPQACGEKCSRYDVWQKFISIGIITAGFILLFI